MYELIRYLADSQTLIGNLPEFVIAIILISIAAIIITAFAAVLALLEVYLERKVSAHMQDRLGPMYVGGWHGWAQTIADAVKLLLKEDIIPKAADKRLHLMAPFIVFAATLAAFVVIPFTRTWIISSLDVGAFYVIAISSFVVIGIILAGWASNNKWSLLGAMRSAAQIVSFEVPSSLAVLVVLMAVGTMNLGKIVEIQDGGIQNWLVWKFFPFNLIAFVVYFIATLAEVNRAPFDIPEAESEIVAGFHTEYSGMKFAMFFLAEYANMFLVGAVAATLFLGGWSSPFGNLIPVLNQGFCQFLWLFLKAMVLIFVHMWLRWTLPRVRVDQLMYTSWKVLTPLGFLAIIGAGLYMIW
ncbi:MAG: NADH-quinone oxidoreductase subunit NuoH [Calditrichaeota bacterium]|nr:MAG: NADH-quinone oxidoreductase subunit NuoH [Calditrichota bacterium]